MKKGEVMNNVFMIKRKLIKLIKELTKNEKCLKGWVIKSIEPDFDYKKHGLEGVPLGITCIEKKTIELATASNIDFNTMATTLFHEIAHVKDKSWKKKEPHNENWGLEFTSLVSNYMKVR